MNLANINIVVKKIFSIILVILVVTFFLYETLLLVKRNNPQKEPEVKGEVTSVFEEALDPIYVEPQSIEISSVGIDAQIESVDVLVDGSLDTPKDWMHAGWYEGGSFPGQKGNLIINAHYDDNFGRPAAFFQLKNIDLDDTVTVVDLYGRRYEYRVTEYQLISINDPDRTNVFKSDESAKITLITCGGVWIPGQATYDKRLVIKGELIQ